MKRLVLFLVVCLALYSQNVYAQEERVEYPRFKIQLESGECIEGKDGYFTSSVFNGISKDGKGVRVDENVIRTIQVPSGSRAGQGALIGAGTGLLISWMIASSVEGIDYDIYMATGLFIPVSAGITGLSAVIGAILGANIPAWKEVPMNTTFNFGVQEKGVSLSVSIPFD